MQYIGSNIPSRNDLGLLIVSNSNSNDTARGQMYHF